MDYLITELNMKLNAMEVRESVLKLCHDGIDVYTRELGLKLELMLA